MERVTAECGAIIRYNLGSFFINKRMGLTHPFIYLEVFKVGTRTLVKSPARSEQSAQDFSLEETKFLKRKSVGTFNASDSREPGEFFIAKIKARLAPALVI